MSADEDRRKLVEGASSNDRDLRQAYSDLNIPWLDSKSTKDVIVWSKEYGAGQDKSRFYQAYINYRVNQDAVAATQKLASEANLLSKMILFATICGVLVGGCQAYAALRTLNQSPTATAADR